MKYQGGLEAPGPDKDLASDYQWGEQDIKTLHTLMLGFLDLVKQLPD